MKALIPGASNIIDIDFTEVIPSGGNNKNGLTYIIIAIAILLFIIFNPFKCSKESPQTQKVDSVKVTENMDTVPRYIYTKDFSIISNSVVINGVTYKLIGKRPIKSKILFKIVGNSIQVVEGTPKLVGFDSFVESNNTIALTRGQVTDSYIIPEGFEGVYSLNSELLVLDGVAIEGRGGTGLWVLWIILVFVLVFFTYFIAFEVIPDLDLECIIYYLIWIVLLITTICGYNALTL